MAGVMTHVGLLENGTISDEARQAFVDLTNLLIGNGTGDFLFGSLPSPIVVSGNSLLANAFNITPIEKHQETFPAWHKIFIDTMYEKTAVALDVNCGGGNLAPFGDPTVAFPDLKLRAGVGIPDFLIGLPALPVSLPDLFDIDPDFLLDFTVNFPTALIPPNIPIPGIPFVPPPTLPAISLPTIPGISLPFDLPSLPSFLFTPPIPPININLPSITLPFPVLGFLLCAVIEAVPIIIAKVLLDQAGFLGALGKGPTGIIIFVALIVLEVIGACLGIELKNVLTFLAGFLVYIEKLVLMLIVLIVGLLFGQGLLVKLVAQVIGLV